MELIPYAERGGDWTYAEVMDATAIAFDDARGLVAIAWSEPWSSQAAHRDRIAVFELATRTCLARFEHARWPTNELAFHPQRAELAIATGEYDGGYIYEGQLLVWNWQTGRWHSELTESREVLRVAYRESGAQLAFVVSPYSDADPFGERAGLVAAAVAGAHRGWLHGESGAPDARFSTTRDALGLGDLEFSFASARDRLALASRPVLADLVWLPDARMAIAHDDGTLVLWQPLTGATTSMRPAADGVACEVASLHVRPNGELVVHVVHHSDPAAGTARTSVLYALDASRDVLCAPRMFPRCYQTAMDASGRMLLRDTSGTRRSQPDRRDLVLAPDGLELLAEDLGEFDHANHALRVEGARSLYFLCGTSSRPYLDKRLYAFDEHGVRDVRAWDDAGPHYMENAAVELDGAALVRSYRVYSSSPSRSTTVIERVAAERADERADDRADERADDRADERADDRADDREWRHTFAVSIVALVHWPAAGCIVASLADRTIAMIDASTGVMRHHAPFELRGTATLVTAIAVHDEAIALGAIDGRVSIRALR